MIKREAMHPCHQGAVVRDFPFGSVDWLLMVKSRFRFGGHHAS